MKKKIAIVFAVIVVVFAGYHLFKKKPVPAQPHTVPVLAGKAVTKAMPVVVEAIGAVEGYRSVTIYTRVQGHLSQIHFKEGQDVKPGDLLFTIDPAPYKTKLMAAKAKLAQDQAQLKFNEDEAKRYAFLMEKGAVSRSDYENKQTFASTQEAIVGASRAEAENARLNLGYCYIRSPIEGRASSYAVNIGRLVKENDTAMTTINQISPAYVKFSVPEKQLHEVRRYLASGTLKVKAIPQGMKDSSVEGSLSFIDNTVDTATGMIVLKATFQNKDKLLWPGQYVNVSMILTTETDAVVIPARAVQISQDGKYLFVVKADMTVEMRPVVVSRTIGGEAVIDKGVKAGDMVVTDGHLKLRPGAKVEIRDSLVPPDKTGGSSKQREGPKAATEPAKTETGKKK